MEAPPFRTGPPCGRISAIRSGTPAPPSARSYPNPPCQYFSRAQYSGPMVEAGIPKWMRGPGPHMAIGEMMMGGSVRPPANSEEMVEMMREMATLVPSADLMREHMAAVGEELREHKTLEAKVLAEAEALQSDVDVAMVQHMKQMSDYMGEQLRADSESAIASRWVLYVLVPAALFAVVLLCVLLCVRRQQRTVGYHMMPEFEPKGTA